MNSASNPVVFCLVQRSMDRAAATARSEMSRGLRDLAVISGTAPFFGILGTCIGIVGSFRGTGGDKWSVYADVPFSISDALLLSVFGLGVAIVAWWAYRYLDSCLDTFEVEMQSASAELLNRLP
jgi:biopolymer transport protein ExbB/TolQ